MEIKDIFPRFVEIKVVENEHDEAVLTSEPCSYCEPGRKKANRTARKPPSSPARREIGTVSGEFAEELLQEGSPDAAPVAGIPMTPWRRTSDARRAEMVLLEMSN